jgi:putative ABC transport system permease protein
MAIVFIIIAVMIFNVFMILGQSLFASRQKVFETQTMGHNYEHHISFSGHQTNSIHGNAILFLESITEFSIGGYDIEQYLIGYYNLNEIYILQNANGNPLPTPEAGTIYINPLLNETYGLNIGDKLILDMVGTDKEFTVKDIAINAEASTIILNINELIDIIGLRSGTYNGALSMDNIPGGTIVTSGQRLEALAREANNTAGAFINQVIGLLSGVILIFLALYINFNDSTRDILILHLMGHRLRSIKKLLVNVYLPIMWSGFLLTLAPGILVAQSIQKSYSIMATEYMPFGINLIALLIFFVILNMAYLGVQALFTIGIKRIIAQEDIAEFVYAE